MKLDLSVPQLVRPYLLSAKLLQEDDFTVYLSNEQFEQALKAAWDPQHQIVDASGKVITVREHLPSILLEADSWDWMGEVVDEDGKRSSGRIHAVRSFGRKAYSVTFREVSPKDAPKAILDHLPDKTFTVSKFGLKTGLLDKKAKKNYVASQARIGELAADSVFGETLLAEGHMRKGLILITGGTGSGKTTIMRGILQRALEFSLSSKNLGSRTRPHLVFIGDPIECFPIQFKKKGESIDQILSLMTETLKECRPFDFTPRVIGKDVSSVDRALIDALRETPAIFVINEMRTDDEIRAALRFAETGHLIVGTAHSTSLQATFRRLISIASASRASDRASLVRQLHSVLHVQAIPPVDSSFEAPRVPTVWRANSEGIRSFVSDGPTSLIPNRARTQNTTTDSAVLGKTWFVDRLIERGPEGDVVSRTARRRWLKQLIQIAQRIDLESL